jgi:hypothetical protein
MAKAAAEALGMSPRDSPDSPAGDSLKLRLLAEDDFGVPWEWGEGKWKGGRSVNQDGDVIYEGDDNSSLGSGGVPEDKGGMSWQDASVMVRRHPPVDFS